MNEMGTTPPAAEEPSPWWQTVAFIAALAALVVFKPNWAATIAFFGLVITVHEFGHFIVARWQGMRVEKFSLGFGPPLIQLKRGDTVYQVAAVPLGGYVKPAGEDPKTDEDIANARPDEFMGKPWWSRGLVLLAGPLMNLIFPVLALFVVYATLGRSYPWGPPMVASVSADSGAAAAGLQPGDRIIRIDGLEVHETKQLTELVDRQSRAHPGKPLSLDLLRGREALHKQVQTRLNDGLGRYLMGVSVQSSPPPFSSTLATVDVLSPAEKAGFKAGDTLLEVAGKPVLDGFSFSEAFATAPVDPVPVTVERDGKRLVLTAAKKQPVPEAFDPKLVGLMGLGFRLADEDSGKRRQKMGPWEALKSAGVDTATATVVVALGIREIFKGRINVRESLGGPIAIMRMAAQQAKRGWEDLFQLMLNISIMLGIMNLLPIPLLDGGTIVFCLIEGARGKPLRMKTQIVWQNLGFALIGSLFLFITINDILRWAGL